ncbi:MAG: glycosyltransferase family 39 protein [Bacteroidales bacterium]
MKYLIKLKNIYSKNNNIDSILILVIIVVGIILRFYKYNEIPFTNDELSALYRARFGSFQELISKGVLIDGHPAGVQVFVYYWIKLVGNSEFIVKLPFLLAGVASIYLIYKIAKFWFNPTVGLISAAYFSCLQYTVMYSQMERPYSSGVFIALAMVWYWTMVFWGSDKNRFYYWTGFLIFGALSAYNHYFNLLFLGFVAITGLFFINRKNWILYISSGIAIFALFIPHLHIFFYQLRVGGVGGTNGWLAAPDYDFIYNYLKFIFHFSKLMYFLVFIIIFYGLILFLRHTIYKNKKANLFRFIAFLWFASTYLTGFYYSRQVAPVLQYSVLIFAFPFLIISLFSFYDDVNKYIKTILILTILVITSYSLVCERKYYSIFYHQGYKECISQIIKINKEISVPPSILFNGFEPFFVNYYEKYFNEEIDCVNFNVDTMNTFKFRELLKKQNKNSLIWADVIPTSPHFQDIIQEEFPYLIKKSMGFGYELYLFSKLKPQYIERPVFISCNNFEKNSPYWQTDTNFILFDTVLNSKIYNFKSEQEWGPLFEANLGEVLSDKFNTIHVSLKANLENIKSNPLLVISIEKKSKECISFHTVEFKKFISQTEKYENVYLTLRMSNVHLRNLNNTLKIYIWNKNKDNFQIDDFKVSIEKGNNLIYSIITDF